jgi:very-short-patch-repair endonuclease
MTKPPGVTARIVAMAGRHGVVARRDLLAAGIHGRAIQQRIEAGLLRRVHHGVYAIGELSPRGRALAAVLACGPGAALSHHSAAALLGIRPEWHGPIHVTARTKHRLRGVVVHRAALATEDRATKDAITLTTTNRTLLDLAALLPDRPLQKAINEAELLKLTTRAELALYASRHNGHRGAKRLAEAAGEPAAPTRSHLEDAFLALVESFDLPRPLINHPIGASKVDFVWPRQRLTVEVDGYETHSTRYQFEEDRRRDVELKLNGWDVLRFSYRQVTREPERVARAVRTLLQRAA